MTCTSRSPQNWRGPQSMAMLCVPPVDARVSPSWRCAAPRADRIWGRLRCSRSSLQPPAWGRCTNFGGGRRCTPPPRFRRHLQFFESVRSAFASDLDAHRVVLRVALAHSTPQPRGAKCYAPRSGRLGKARLRFLPPKGIPSSNVSADFGHPTQMCALAHARDLRRKFWNVNASAQRAKVAAPRPTPHDNWRFRRVIDSGSAGLP